MKTRTRHFCMTILAIMAFTEPCSASDLDPQTFSEYELLLADRENSSGNALRPTLSHHDDHEHEHAQDVEDEHQEGHEHEERPATSSIDSNLAAQVGIETVFPVARKLEQTLTTYGTLSLGPEQVAHVGARFPGLIKSVKFSIGDTVEVGALLAEVESDESLSLYPVRSPVKGRIVALDARNGELTQDKILYSIANFDTLWAELRIFATQHQKVAAGKNVELIVGKQKINGEISHIIPSASGPYQLARVNFDNRDLQLSPNMLVEGRIVVDEFAVTLAVEKLGLQEVDGLTGVFVRENDTYRFAPLSLGRTDKQFVEVLGGIEANQQYVNRNSYLLKADLEKSSADHDH